MGLTDAAGRSGLVGFSYVLGGRDTLPLEAARGMLERFVTARPPAAPRRAPARDRGRDPGEAGAVGLPVMTADSMMAPSAAAGHGLTWADGAREAYRLTGPG
jgi:hypothetical protein